MNIELDISFDRTIDPDALDVEWLEHAHKFGLYSTNLDEKTRIRNDLKTDLEYQKELLDQVRASLDLAIRKAPHNFGLEKVTESSIASTILKTKLYIDTNEKLFSIKKDLNKAQNEVNEAHTMVNIMLAKRTALQELGNLIRIDYFSSPVEPRNLQKEFAKRREHQEEIKMKAKEKIRKRRR